MEFLIRQIKQSIGYYCSLVFMVSVIPLLFIKYNNSIRYLIDAINGGDIPSIRNAIWIMIFYQVVHETAWRIRDYVRIYFTSRVVMNSFNDISHILIDKSYDFFEKNNPAYLSSITKEIPQHTQRVLNLTCKITRCILYIIFGSINILLINLSCGITIIIWTLLSGIAIYFIFVSTSLKAGEIANLTNKLIGALSETLLNIQSVIVHKMQKYEKRKINTKTYVIKNKQVEFDRIFFYSWVFQGFAFAIIICVMLFLLVNSSTNIMYDAGKIVNVMLLTKEFFQIIWTLSEDVYDFIESYGKLQNDLRVINGTLSNINVEKKNDHIQNRVIRFDNVSITKYKHNFNFTCSIHKGETVFLVGKSGSGKSTFVKILIGVIKNYDGKFYNNISDKIVYIPQNVTLFTDTIKYNICYGNENQDISTLLQEDLLAFVNQLEKKENTIVNLDNLSGGEAQRILIARALLSKAKIIVCDEPTSALDEHNKKITLDFLSKMKATKIIITHDIKYCIDIADRVMLFEGESIKEYTRDEFLQSAYYLNLLK